MILKEDRIREMTSNLGGEIVELPSRTQAEAAERKRVERMRRRLEAVAR